jgi:hypothetical protein
MTVSDYLQSENHSNRSKINTSNTHIHDHSLSSLGTGTSNTKLGNFAKLDTYLPDEHMI